MKVKRRTVRRHSRLEVLVARSVIRFLRSARILIERKTPKTADELRESVLTRALPTVKTVGTGIGMTYNPAQHSHERRRAQSGEDSGSDPVRS